VLASCVDGVLEGESEGDHAGVDRLAGADGPGEVPGVHGDVEHAHLEQLGTGALARPVAGRAGHGTGFAEGCFQLGRGRGE
jgi:hypothetical protein